MSEKKEKKSKKTKKVASTTKGDGSLVTETRVKDKRDLKEKAEDDGAGSRKKKGHKEDQDTVSKIKKSDKPTARKGSTAAGGTKKKKGKEESEDPTPKMEWEFTGEWEPELSSGGPMDQPTWRDNPQVFITVLKDTKVEISLTQRSSKNSIGFAVLEGDGTGRRIIGSPKKLIIAETPFAKTKEVTKVYTLDAIPQPYVIIPATSEPNVAGKFTLRITSQEAKVVAEMHTQRRAMQLSTHNGEWKGETAGGCKNNSTFIHNPQYLIEVPNDKTQVQLLVLQTAKSKFDDVGMYLAKLTSGEDSSSKLVSAPANIIDKANFSNPKEAHLVSGLDAGRYVVIPCTFDPRNEGVFQLRVYTDKDVSVSLLGEKKGTTFSSEWKGETAGGCMNHSTWRKNPHFALTVNKKVPFTLALSQKGPKRHVIGYYIVSSDKYGNKRTLVNRRKHVLDKSDFVEMAEIAKQITLEPSKNPYIVLPCTFDKANEAPFNLTLYPSGSPEDVTLAACTDNLAEIILPGEWTSANSGGCKNYYSWPSNPQYLLEAETAGTITLFLTVPEKENGKYKKSIGMYVHKVKSNRDGGFDPVYDESVEIVARARFSKQKQVFCKFRAEKGDRFIVLAALFHAGQKSKYTISAAFSAYSAPSVRFNPLPGKQFLFAKGAWTAESAGGCINRPSWVHNPHFALSVKRKCKALFVLVQHPDINGRKKKDWEAIGLYVNKGNEWGFPQLKDESDLVGKSDFEKFRDACVTITLEPTKDPYIVTPSTFDSGYEANFQILIFASEQDIKDNLAVKLIDYRKVLDAADEGEKLDSPRVVEPEPEPVKKPKKAEEPKAVTIVPEPVAIAPPTVETVAPAQSEADSKRKADDIRKKANILRQKETELTGKENDLAKRLEALERREKEVAARDVKLNEKEAQRKKRWRERKALHKQQLKEAESKGFMQQKESVEREQEAKAQRRQEKIEAREREAQEKAEREKRELEERLQKEEEEKLKRKAEKKKAKTEIPSSVTCPSCGTSFDPLNPEATASVSLEAILAPPPPPPSAPVPPPPVAPAPIIMAPKAPPPPMDLPHEEFKVPRKPTGDDFLGMLRQGIQLHDAGARKLKDITPKEGADWAVPFNLEKIVARRNAMEMSDDEDEEYDDDWS